MRRVSAALYLASHGWLAQLVRAPVSHTGGHWFESSTAHLFSRDGKLSIAAALVALAIVTSPPFPLSTMWRGGQGVRPESTGVRPESTWARTGAIAAGLTGGAIFTGAFYKFTHRTGAVNNGWATLGGTLVGTAIGAAGGALFGSFIGSLFPKHRSQKPAAPQAP